NGVVLISTKKGKEGQTNVNFGVQYGNSKPTRVVKFLNSAQYLDYYRKAAANSDRIDGLDPADPDSYTSYMEGFFDGVSIGTFGTSNQADTKWDELAFQDAPQKQFDLSIDGGNAKTKFFVSGQFLDQDGIMVGNKLKRMTGRINLDHEVSKVLNIGFNLGLSRTFNERLDGDNAFSNPLQIVALTPLSPLYDPTTNLLIGSPPGDIGQPLYYNPLLNLEGALFNTNVHRNLSNAYGVLKIASGLTFRSEFGIDLLDQNEESYNSSISQRNTGFALGTGSNFFTRVENLNTNNYFSFNKKFGAHKLDLTAGMSYQQSKQDFSSVTGTDFPSDAYKKIASAAKITAGTSTETNFRFLSYFARANYKLAEKYLLGLSARVDGSSRFGVDSRYGFFPAVSAGWIVSEEGFLQGSKLISFLKLRGSYGQTGNAEIGNFPQLGLFSGDAGYGNKPGQRPSQLGNPDLRWETTNQMDLGIDFGLFRDRINGEIDVYQKKTDGLLLNVNVPATTGFSTVTKNVGKLENKGVELALNATLINGRDFKWDLGFNYGLNINKINDLQGQIIEGGLSNMSRAMEGQPLSTFFTVEYAGVDPANGDALWYKNIKNTDGTIDRGTTATYNQAQRVVIGNGLPKWIGGLTSSIKFKGLELSMLWNTVQGNLVNFYGAGRFSSANGRFEDNQTVDQLNSWTPQNTNTNIPEARLFFNNGAQASSRFIQDGSFIRLRNATIGYTLPKTLLKNAGIKSARIYVTGLNLLTLTKYTGWDPEVNSDDFVTNVAQGYDFYSPPMPRSIIGGINVKF
ncbi:MAG: SusC/RagA family TonB-linked outer membrane protein, partial [Saprospiraceae bacterium]